MNPLALFFASGESLYPGAGLLILGIMADPYLSRGRVALASAAATWVGLAMVVMASPPVSGWIVAGFSAAFLLWIMSSLREDAEMLWNRLRRGGAAILLAMLLMVTGSELGHRKMPKFQGVPADHLVVIGDSISAGIDPRVHAWPAVMQRQTGISVKNLSQAGATVAETRGMVAKVTQQDAVVLIELGGNDLLSGVSSYEFGKGLNSLLGGLQLLSAP